MEKKSAYGGRIGILGGTFDPIHTGHIEIGRYCLNKFDLDKIIVLPVGDPPHKTNRHVTDKYLRLKMTELALENEEGFIICDDEVERKGYTYTVDTLNNLKNKYEYASFFYIIGADTLNELHTWNNIAKVTQLTKFIVVGRNNVDFKELKSSAESIEKEFNAQLLYADFTGPDISSTNIRDNIKNGISISQMVPQKVEEFINEKNLYR